MELTIVPAARPHLHPAFLPTSPETQGRARLRPAHPRRHRPRRSVPPCGSLKGHATTSASKLPCGSSPHLDSTSPRPATSHVDHTSATCAAGVRAVPSCWCWWWCWSWCNPSYGRRPAVQRGRAPVIRGRIDRPCKGTFRGGAPWTGRFRRKHDLTSAQRSCRLRPSPTAQHASAPRTPDGTIPVPPARDAAAPKTHRPPRRASSHRTHRPTPRARDSAQRHPT